MSEALAQTSGVAVKLRVAFPCLLFLLSASMAAHAANAPRIAIIQHPGHMDWLMQEIEAQGELLFVDSYTTHRSVALDFARENGIPAVKRDVFLGPDRSLKTLEREFERLKRLSRSQGMAVGIGHPYPQTLAFLERELPDLADQGFELVGIGDYISNYVAGSTAAAYAGAAGHGAPVDAAGE
ncbi:MAG TPA: divergent polysaccharide deacetylase family protein [Woeseiaceae bacterium]|nr:divergent polysaccharide deacetylase family protein [Woeseiaceae bacterium]